MVSDLLEKTMEQLSNFENLIISNYKNIERVDWKIDYSPLTTHYSQYESFRIKFAKTGTCNGMFHCHYHFRRHRL